MEKPHGTLGNRNRDLPACDPKAIVLADGFKSWKNPMAPSGIETATFRLVAQLLNQLRNRVSADYWLETRNDPSSCSSVYNWYRFFYILVDSSYRLCFVAVPSAVWCSLWRMIGYLFIPDSIVGTEANDIWSTSMRCVNGFYLFCPLQSSPCFNYWPILWYTYDAAGLNFIILH